MAGIWDFLNPNKKKKPTDQVNALEAVVAPKPQNFLSQFLPEDPNKREALSKALIMGGASAMAAGGPSDKPMNLLSVLGSGLAGAVGGYDESLQNSADSAYKNAAVSANALKMQQSALGTNLQEEFFRKWGPPGPAGYPPEALYDLQKMQLATGDEESARATQKQIQQLQQTGAEKGFLIGEEGFQLAPGFGEGLFDTKKAESLGNAVGQNAQITADQKDYLYGKENPDFLDQQLKLKKAGVAAPDNKFFGKSSEHAAERFAAYQEEGLKAKALSSNVNRLAELSRSIGTGKWAELKKTVGPWAKAVGVDVEGLDDIQAFESMVSKVAPSMRVPGSGATSDFDAKQFLQSLPTLSNTTEGNALIARTTGAIEQNKIAAAEIANRVYDPEDPLYGDWQAAEKQINALPDPFTEFREYRGSSNASADPERTGSLQADPASSAPVVRNGWEYFIGTDGKKYKRPVGNR
ncbi:hypothetical protein GOL31_23600 [Sinorhizobium medicae]|nr:hypothetical protein [Sinorhizobium medicae]